MILIIIFALLIGGVVATWLLKGAVGESVRIPTTDAAKIKMDKKTAHQVLGIAANASEDDAKEAYRRLVQKLHPDQNGSAYLMDLVVRAKQLLIKE